MSIEKKWKKNCTNSKTQSWQKTELSLFRINISLDPWEKDLLV